MTSGWGQGDLCARIGQRIRHDGPLSVAEYMAMCLLDPAGGYYATRDPFGSAGDFITAPEVSQMFGELIGIWLRQIWREDGRSDPIRLIELGPGRGTLMADVLRAIDAEPQMRSAVSVHLVEASPTLAALQQARLADHASPKAWHERIEDVPPGRSYILANEFFDALPVRQFQFDGAQWAERVIGMDLEEEGVFRFGLKPARFDPGTQAPGLDPPRAGDIVEVSPARTVAAERVANRLAADGGAALIIDYGHGVSGYGDTLQAVRRHAFADVLVDPGTADITAHVDFAQLARTLREHGAVVHGLATQAQFLLAMGLVERAGQLGAGKPAKVQDALAAAVERLAGDAQMGQMFKVLCATGDETVPYPFDQLTT